MQEAEQLVRLAAERGRLLTVYQDRRWDGAFLTVKKLLASGALGSVAEYEARFDRFRLEAKANAWRERPESAAAGVLWDLGPHLIDGALVLFGVPASPSLSACTDYRLRSRATLAASRNRRFIREVLDGSSGRDSARRELPRRP
jgi:predicted dehydrogenase